MTNEQAETIIRVLGHIEDGVYQLMLLLFAVAVAFLLAHILTRGKS